MTLKKDSKDYQFLYKNLLQLCEEVHQIIRKIIIDCSNQLEYNFVQSDLSNKSKSRMLKKPTDSLEEITKKLRTITRRSFRKSKYNNKKARD